MLRLFYRLMVRPLFREPIRTSLIILCVALGIGVVLAIELASDAATGSFRSSMETLTGDNNLEITATGSVPDAVVGALASLPYDIRVAPRVEGYASVVGTRQNFPLIGLDLVAQANAIAAPRDAARDDGSESDGANANSAQSIADSLRSLNDPFRIWTPSSLAWRQGDRVPLLINDQIHDYTVAGTYQQPDQSDAAIVMDIAAAQRALSRQGRVDRILLKVPGAGSLDEWQQRIAAALPAGVSVEPVGTGTEENRRMLSAFRWNLRLLSYISLVVGAFLIYNTISISVVRRRPEIGIVRALGASRGAVLGAFLGEAATLGFAGAVVGLPIGRFMAVGAVKLMAATVQSLYTSSQPGPIALSPYSVLLAFAIGIGASLASAFPPAREAVAVPPVEAIARGRREYEVRVHQARDLWLGLPLAAAAAASSCVPAIAGKPYFGYAATVILIAAAALAIPALVTGVTRLASRWLGRLFGPVALLASRSLAGSLRRTSGLVAALATAVAMMVSVGIMVGSFRETVVSWMDDTLPADLFVRAAGQPAADRHPTLSPDLAAKIAALGGVAAVDRSRIYETAYQHLPIRLVGDDFSSQWSERRSDFFSGRPAAEVVAELQRGNNVAVSEPFSYNHHISAGDTITLALGGSFPRFRVVDVYYDYSSERGEILMPLATLQKYLPDPAPSSLAVYLSPDASLGAVRSEILDAASGSRFAVISNRELRTAGIRVFDRTFAITYALEAIAVTVAILGIAGALLALVIDRRRELSLLRFLGSTSGQIRKLILFEAGLLGLFANLIGAGLGYFLSLILIYVIEKQSFGWTIRFHWPVAVLLGALTLVYLSTIAAGIYPATTAVHLDPLEAVHED